MNDTVIGQVNNKREALNFYLVFIIQSLWSQFIIIIIEFLLFGRSIKQRTSSVPNSSFVLPTCFK